MAFDLLQKNYETLTEEQQMIVYNLVLSLVNLNTKPLETPEKRTFGQFAGKATAVFSDSWEMTEEELCSL
ncbi:MAG: hypothetical protein IKX23_10110 [Treponema sp.]|nr:hypothetical protein [Treponema sp.]